MNKKQEGRELQPVHKLSLPERVHMALGPVTGGLLLDFLDLATFGSIGLHIGPLVGALVGWWVSSIYGFKIASRIFWITLASLYCAIPATEIIPVATIISTIAKFAGRSLPDNKQD